MPAPCHAKPEHRTYGRVWPEQAVMTPAAQAGPVRTFTRKKFSIIHALLAEVDSKKSRMLAVRDHPGLDVADLLPTEASVIFQRGIYVAPSSRPPDPEAARLAEMLVLRGDLRRSTAREFHRKAVWVAGSLISGRIAYTSSAN